MSEDDLGEVEPDLSVDEVSSSSDDNASSSSSSSENEESEQDIHDWGTRKSNYYGGMEDVVCFDLS